MRDDRSGEPQAPNEDSAEDADPRTAHPVEPAEGARDPGTETTPDRAEHPTEPAEGERD